MLLAAQLFDAQEDTCIYTIYTTTRVGRKANGNSVQYRACVGRGVHADLWVTVLHMLVPALARPRYIKFDTFHPAVERGLPVTRVISRVKLQEILARAATRCATGLGPRGVRRPLSAFMCSDVDGPAWSGDCCGALRTARSAQHRTRLDCCSFRLADCNCCVDASPRRALTPVQVRRLGCHQ